MEKEFQAAVEQLGGLDVAGPAAVWATLHPQFLLLTKKVLRAIDGTSMYLVIYNQAVDQTRTFNISFDEGPSTMTTALQVELSTDDLNDTPVYNGAFLIEV